MTSIQRSLVVQKVKEVFFFDHEPTICNSHLTKRMVETLDCECISENDWEVSESAREGRAIGSKQTDELINFCPQFGASWVAQKIESETSDSVRLPRIELVVCSGRSRQHDKGSIQLVADLASDNPSIYDLFGKTVTAGLGGGEATEVDQHGISKDNSAGDDFAGVFNEAHDPVATKVTDGVPLMANCGEYRAVRAAGQTSQSDAPSGLVSLGVRIVNDGVDRLQFITLSRRFEREVLVIFWRQIACRHSAGKSRSRISLGRRLLEKPRNYGHSIPHNQSNHRNFSHSSTIRSNAYFQNAYSFAGEEAA